MNDIIIDADKANKQVAFMKTYKESVVNVANTALFVDLMNSWKDAKKNEFVSRYRDSMKTVGEGVTIIREYYEDLERKIKELSVGS